VQEGVEGALAGEIGRSDHRFAVAALNGADGQHGERQRGQVGRSARRGPALTTRGEDGPALRRNTRP
jgi:hypothetical protein